MEGYSLLDFLWVPAFCYMLLRHEFRIRSLEKRLKDKERSESQVTKDDFWERYERTRPK